MIFNNKKSDHNYYQPSRYNTTFDFSGNNFNDYIEHVRKKIYQARLDLCTDYPEKIIEANSPFAWLQEKNFAAKKRGVLLIHGLYDSPFSLRDLGHIFYQQGFSVYSILLPGHGTRPGDLLSIHRQSWRDAVNFGVNALSGVVDELYLCGFSTGGLLCIDYQLNNPHTPIQKLITLAPPIAIKNIASFLSPWLSPIMPWVSQNIENNYVKYRSFATQGVAEVYRLSQEVAQKIKQKQSLKLELFMAFSMADHIVSAKACERFFTRFASENSHCLIYCNTPHIGHDIPIQYTHNVFSEHSPSILKHNGLPFSIDNLHYGQHGDYREEDELLYNPGFDVLAKAVIDSIR